MVKFGRVTLRPLMPGAPSWSGNRRGKRLNGTTDICLLPGSGLKEVQKSSESRNRPNILVFGRMKVNSNRKGTIDGNGTTKTGVHIF